MALHLEKLATFFCSLLSLHTHCTKFSGLASVFLPITASVIQGSAIGPASVVVNAANLTLSVIGVAMGLGGGKYKFLPSRAIANLTAGNSLAKYADDTHLIVPAIDS